MRIDHKNLLLILYLIVAAAVLGCNGDSGAANDQVSMRLEVDPNLPRVGPSHLMVAITDIGGQALNGAEVTAEGTMDMDGMQPLLVSLNGTDSGHYEAPFAWTMSGDWTMSVDASLPDGRKITRDFPVTVAEEGSEHMEDHDNMTMDHPNRVPNEDRQIRLLSPGLDQKFQAGEDIKVEVGFENFKLVDEGNHWHVYVDGRSAQMVMGEMNEVILRDLSPGSHEISVYMSINSHEELEDGASVMINIEE